MYLHTLMFVYVRYTFKYSIHRKIDELLIRGFAVVGHIFV